MALRSLSDLCCPGPISSPVPTLTLPPPSDKDLVGLMGGRPGPEPPPTCEAQEGSSSKAESGSPEGGQVGTGTPTSHRAHTGS